MDEKSRRAIAGSLGDPDRDFKENPLTQFEMHSIVQVYSHESERKDVDPELREIYRTCVEMLKKHLIFQ